MYHNHAFAFPYCQLPDWLLKYAAPASMCHSLMRSRATFCLLQSGAWCNPIAYWIMAYTGCPNPLFANSPNLLPPTNEDDPAGDNNPHTQLVMFLLQGPTGQTSLEILKSRISVVPSLDTLLY